jgi:formylglycine-generating enzyme required for sulfatase activity
MLEHDREDEMVKHGRVLFIALTLLFFSPAARAEELPPAGSGQSFRDCPECPELVVIPAGNFKMGSPESEPERRDTEGPQHEVMIGERFAVGKYAVTFAEWDACVEAGGCGGYRPRDGGYLRDEGWGRGDRPVIHVSWRDAKAYVEWLSQKTSKGYRLLSEAEREYVTRAGTQTPFWWGSSISTEQANYAGDSMYAGGGKKGEYRQKTVPVKSFQPNPWGLYQVHGNVWEWVEDCLYVNYNHAGCSGYISQFGASYCGTPIDGSAWTGGNCEIRVLRGGAESSVPGLSS